MVQREFLIAAETTVGAVGVRETVCTLIARDFLSARNWKKSIEMKSRIRNKWTNIGGKVEHIPHGIYRKIKKQEKEFDRMILKGASVNFIKELIKEGKV